MTSLNERELEKKTVVGETWALTVTSFTGDTVTACGLSAYGLSWLAHGLRKLVPEPEARATAS